MIATKNQSEVGLSLDMQRLTEKGWLVIGDCTMTIFQKTLHIFLFNLDADKTVHNQLQEDLIEHLWQRHGDQY
uniref:Uncharacterized protein n=2 Tax=Oryza TaxID=4527 RepID=A0A0E0QQ77_ORYRU